MNTTNNTLNNLPINKGNSSLDVSTPIFYENNLLDSYPTDDKKKLERVHKVLEFIKNNEGLHISEIARRMNMARTTLNSIITNLEFAKVIYSKMSMRKNTAIRLIFYSAETKKEAEELDTPSPSTDQLNTGENKK